MAIQPIPNPPKSLCVKPIYFQCSTQNVVWDCVQGLTEVKRVDSYSSCLALSTAEGHKISQAQFDLVEAMLVASNHLPVFHMLGHVLQENLFHDFKGAEVWLAGQYFIP